jgi:hypothetical protein
MALVKNRCNLPEFVRKMRAARRMPIAREFRPLRDHLLKLAANARRTGYCQQAGQEIRMAVNLANKYPGQRGR